MDMLGPEVDFAGEPATLTSPAREGALFAAGAELAVALAGPGPGRSLEPGGGGGPSLLACVDPGGGADPGGGGAAPVGGGGASIGGASATAGAASAGAGATDFAIAAAYPLQSGLYSGLFVQGSAV